MTSMQQNITKQNMTEQNTRNGIEQQTDSSQERLLTFLYDTPAGRILLKPLLRPWVSQLGGALLSSGWSRFLIPPFIRRNNIDMCQFQPQHYHSYNDFFSRKIRPEVRPIDRNPVHLISPCDSKLKVLPITSDSRFTLKHTSYSVSSLLQNKSLARRYRGGYALIFRLTVDDYHRYCYVADGIKVKTSGFPAFFTR